MIGRIVFTIERHAEGTNVVIFLFLFFRRGTNNMVPEFSFTSYIFYPFSSTSYNLSSSHENCVLSCAKESAPFFDEARFRLAALNVFVKGRPLRLRYVCIMRCLTNRGFPASLSSRANPELPTEILPRWKKGAISFVRDSTVLEYVASLTLCSSVSLVSRIPW